MNNYLNNNIDNPVYLFKGISNIGDDNDNMLTSSFIVATAYAFKAKIKELSNGLDYYIEIGYDRDNNKPDILFKDVNIDDNIEAYIYVYPYNEEYEHTKGSIHYKTNNDIDHIDIVKVRFGDYKNYYKFS